MILFQHIEYLTNREAERKAKMHSKAPPIIQPDLSTGKLLASPHRTHQQPQVHYIIITSSLHSSCPPIITFLYIQ